MPTAGWLYDLFMQPLGWLGLDRLREQLVRDARGRTLEIGAGTGLNLCHYTPGVDEIHRVLNRSGELRMLEHIRPTGRLLGWLADRLTPSWKGLAGGCHLNRRTVETLAAATESASGARSVLERLRSSACGDDERRRVHPDAAFTDERREGASDGSLERGT
jgi:hypothetical protein